MMYSSAITAESALPVAVLTAFSMVRLLMAIAALVALVPFVLLGVVFKSNCSQFRFEFLLVDVHVLAKVVERGIFIAQFRVDHAEEHHGVLR